MHENKVLAAIRDALYRNLPHMKETSEGRSEIEKIAVEAMTNIREQAIIFASAGEKPNR
ncbi:MULTISPECIES: hypothetical protein [unclassified Rhizobium]|jgi:hypothetical protein|uniref:hypothetical protein n=1 Tax=unclassified Rhizobium TaxID=2613769 RepID=UPI000AA212A0